MIRCLALLIVAWFLAACSAENPGSDGEKAAAHPGEQIYFQSCFSCHAGGVGGAPRTGDQVAWQERLDKGRDVLLQSTIDGIPPAMPEKGLCNSCTDAQLADVIDYMLVESGLNQRD